MVLACGWMAMQYLPLGVKHQPGALALSPPVKAYIDSKLGGADGSCGDAGKLKARLDELEARVGDIDKLRALESQIEAKRAQLDEAVARQNMDQTHRLNKVRDAEVTRVRTDVGTMCAGVTAKSVAEARADRDEAVPPSRAEGQLNPRGRRRHRGRGAGGDAAGMNAGRAETPATAGNVAVPRMPTAVTPPAAPPPPQPTPINSGWGASGHLTPGANRAQGK